MIGSRLILLICIFMNMLALIWSILVMQGIIIVLLAIGLIMEWSVDMSTYTIYRFSNTSSLMMCKIVYS